MWCRVWGGVRKARVAEWTWLGQGVVRAEEHAVHASLGVSLDADCQCVFAVANTKELREYLRSASIQGDYRGNFGFRGTLSTSTPVRR